MKYFLVLCLLFCGFSGLAQKYYTGYYQENDNAIELKTVPINSKKNEVVYGDLPTLIKFSPLSDSLICNFVYDKVSEANWREIENNTSNKLKSSAINGIVTCVNQVFGQKLLLPDGNVYTGPFFAMDENKLYLKGKCLEGLLIDTLLIVNYELNSKKFPISSRTTNMGGIKDFGEVDSSGSLFIVFKRVSVLEDYPIKCTNVVLQYYHKGEEYFLQAWSHFPNSPQTNQQSGGKIYFNSFKSKIIAIN